MEGSLGTFRVHISFGHMDGGDLREVEVLVDTGATHTVLPDTLLRQMSMEPAVYRAFSFADGAEEIWPVGMARIAYGGEQWPCPVVFSPYDQRLLGATTLEAFNLAVDPVNRSLIPAKLEGRTV